jgi:negative regulator of flagellin synthesis FlgM
MKVQNNLPGLSQIAGAAEVSAVQQASSQGSVTGTGRTDEAHLSPAAQLVSQALALPEVRSDKVASVQAALANGTYQVSSSDVAAKMMDNLGSKHQ